MFSSILRKAILAGIHPIASSGLSDFGSFLEAESLLKVVRGAASQQQGPCSEGSGATSKPAKIVNSPVLGISVLRGMSAVTLRSGI